MALEFTIIYNICNFNDPELFSLFFRIFCIIILVWVYCSVIIILKSKYPILFYEFFFFFPTATKTKPKPYFIKINEFLCRLTKASFDIDSFVCAWSSQGNGANIDSDWRWIESRRDIKGVYELIIHVYVEEFFLQ